MKVLNPRAALLSDFEVLQLLRDLEAEQEATLRTPTASRSQSPSLSHEAALAQIPSNLRTIQFELQAYLGNVQSPSAHQDPASVSRFLEELREWERNLEPHKRLTKGERLMILNHAPRAVIELYTMIEEMPLRLDDEEQQSLLEVIDRTLPSPVVEHEADVDQSATGNNELFLGDDTQAEIDYEAAENGAYGGHDEEEDAEGLEFEGGAEGAVDDERGDEE